MQVDTGIQIDLRAAPLKPPADLLLCEVEMKTLLRQTQRNVTGPVGRGADAKGRQRQGDAGQGGAQAHRAEVRAQRQRKTGLLGFAHIGLPPLRAQFLNRDGQALRHAPTGQCPPAAPEQGQNAKPSDKPAHVPNPL